MKKIITLTALAALLIGCTEPQSSTYNQPGPQAEQEQNGGGSKKPSGNSSSAETPHKMSAEENNVGIASYQYGLNPTPTTPDKTTTDQQNKALEGKHQCYTDATQEYPFCEIITPTLQPQGSAEKPCMSSDEPWLNWAGRKASDAANTAGSMASKIYSKMPSMPSFRSKNDASAQNKAPVRSETLFERSTTDQRVKGMWSKTRNSGAVFELTQRENGNHTINPKTPVANPSKAPSATGTFAPWSAAPSEHEEVQSTRPRVVDYKASSGTTAMRQTPIIKKKPKCPPILGISLFYDCE